MLPLHLQKPSLFDEYLRVGNEEKDIDKYLFTLVPSLHLLTIEELRKPETKKAVKNIKPIDPPKVTKEIADASNPVPIYVSFITGIRPLLQDYSDTGVKILMNIPDFSMTGGKRRKSRKASKKSRKQRSRKQRSKSLAV
jgi:hypothetical protein